jgi:hypothetical protein
MRASAMASGDSICRCNNMPLVSSQKCVFGAAAGKRNRLKARRAMTSQAIRTNALSGFRLGPILRNQSARRIEDACLPDLPAREFGRTEQSGFQRYSIVLRNENEWREVCAMKLGYARVSTNEQDTGARCPR